MKIWIGLIVLLAGGLVSTNAAETNSSARGWEESVVTLDIKRKQYDYLQPWITPMQNLQKFGVVLTGKQLLTTADGLADLTLLRVQREGRGKWYIGQVDWIDYHANLALLKVEEGAFWTGLKETDLAAQISPSASMQLIRWKSGKLETRRAEFNQFTVEDGKLSYVQYAQLELNSEINGAGWGEPVVADGKVLGLTGSQTGNSCKIIPSPFIRSILEARKKGDYRGLGYFDFVWQLSENPATHKFLKLEGAQRGVVVVDPQSHPGRTNKLKAMDVILQIDEFPIDSTGDYRDPAYGHLSLENLATRNKWAGDTVNLKVWRDGETIDIPYEIPKVEYTAKLVPDHIFDQPPEYLMVAGLLFQPLSNTYLRSWGGDWRRRAPFRLTYYNNEPITKDRPSVVVLSQVLPDPINLGYQEYRFLAVDKVNGKKIATLADLQQALKEPQDGFHNLEFTLGDNLRKMVLDAADEVKATERVLNRYGIEKPLMLNQKPGPVAAR